MAFLEGVLYELNLNLNLKFLIPESGTLNLKP